MFPIYTLSEKLLLWEKKQLQVSKIGLFWFKNLICNRQFFHFMRSEEFTNNFRNKKRSCSAFFPSVQAKRALP